MKPVVAAGVVDDRGELVVHGSQVRRRVAFAVLARRAHELVLSADDVDALDVAHAHLSEEGQKLGPYDVLFVHHRVLPDARRYVFPVDFDELLEGHLHRAAARRDELVFPFLGFFGRCETALALMDLVARAVLAAELGHPSPVLSDAYGHPNHLLS